MAETMSKIRSDKWQLDLVTEFMLTLGVMPGVGYVYEWEWDSGRLEGEWGEEVDITRLDSTTEGT